MSTKDLEEYVSNDLFNYFDKLGEHEMDANTVMEQIQMAESRHMRMGALCSYLLQYPDMTIREFFTMASQEIRDQEEELGYYE